MQALLNFLASLRNTAKDAFKVELSGSNVEQTPDSAAPTKGNMVGGKYSVADPSVDDGDFVALRTNAKGEVLISIADSPIAIPVDIQYNQLGVSDALPVKKAVQVRVINAGSTTQVAAAGTENIDISPTTGYKGRLLGIILSCNAPSGAGSGNHYFKLWIDSFSPCRVLASYDKKLLVDYYEKGTDTTLSPADTTAFFLMLTNIIFTETNPLRIAYTNGTNVTQTNGRGIYLLIEEEAIA